MPYDEARAVAYDRAHPQRFAEAEGAVAFLAALVPPSGRVLELGVGTGRLALPLAERGIEVWGVDDSEPMVARLRAKPGGDRVHVVVGDFARVGDLTELARGGFALAYVAFNTLFELPSQDAQVSCFAGVERLLAPGGLFIVEAIAPDMIRLDQTVSVLSLDAGAAVLQATRHDPGTQHVTGADVTLSTAGGVQVSPWTIRYASVPELDLMARLAGLCLRDRWGGWSGQPFTAASTMHVSVYERSRPLREAERPRSPVEEAPASRAGMGSGGAAPSDDS